MSDEIPEHLIDMLHSALPGVIPIRLCGKGNFGEVYLACDASMRKVALKIPSGNGRNWECERRGLNVYCQRIPVNEYLVTIHQISPSGQPFCYSMELADNFNAHDSALTDNYLPDTLSARLRTNGAMSLAEIAENVSCLCDGVKILHHAGLCHRDIKPGNIFFFGDHCKLGDIGLVEQSDGAQMIGTPAFLPVTPVDESMGATAQAVDADLYALGMTIYCMMTGLSARKFPLLPEEILGNSELLCLNKFVLKACDSNPAERFKSIEDFQEAFSKAVIPFLDGYRRRRRIAIAMNVIVAVAMIGLGMMLALNFIQKENGREEFEEEWSGNIAFEEKSSNVPQPTYRNTAILKYDGRPVELPSDGKIKWLSFDEVAGVVEKNFEIYIEIEAAESGSGLLLCRFAGKDTGDAFLIKRSVSYDGVSPFEKTPSAKKEETALPRRAEGMTKRRLGVRVLRVKERIGIYCNSMPAGVFRMKDNGPWQFSCAVLPGEMEAGSLVVKRLVIYEAPEE